MSGNGFLAQGDAVRNIQYALRILFRDAQLAVLLLMIGNTRLTDHDGFADKREEGNANPRKCIEGMNQFHLRNGSFHPGSNFVRKVALPVEDYGRQSLPVDVACNDAAKNAIEKIEPLVVGVPGNITNGATGSRKAFVKEIVVRTACEKNDASFVAEHLGNACMHGFCAAYMIKREEEKDFIFRIQGAQRCYQPSQPDKGQEQDVFNGSFYDVQPEHYVRLRKFFLMFFIQPIMPSASIRPSTFPSKLPKRPARNR